jgi:hypothetical protein
MWPTFDQPWTVLASFGELQYWPDLAAGMNFEGHTTLADCAWPVRLLAVRQLKRYALLACVHEPTYVFVHWHATPHAT